MLFPEGTRSYDGEIGEAKLGIGMIAYNTRVPVIPVYIKGSNRIMPRDSKVIYFKPCSVYYGNPVELEPYYQKKKSKELYREISKKIMEGIRELREQCSTGS